MTTAQANRPLFYMGSKYAKGDTFQLVENDGVLWGKDAITVVKIRADEEPPEIARPPKPAKKSPDTMSAMMKIETADRERVAKAKTATTGATK